MGWGRKGGSKYGNKKTFCNTLQVTMDSIWEHDLYHMLLDLQNQGKISELKHQSHHDLYVNEEKICRLELDYEFIWLNKKRYADAKSPATAPPSFTMKAKLFKAIMNEPVHLIERRNLGIFPNLESGEEWDGKKSKKSKSRKSV